MTWKPAFTAILNMTSKRHQELFMEYLFRRRMGREKESISGSGSAGEGSQFSTGRDGGIPKPNQSSQLRGQLRPRRGQPFLFELYGVQGLWGHGIRFFHPGP